MHCGPRTASRSPTATSARSRPDGCECAVEACGICGSDLHFWHGHLPRPIGTSPGHEFAGTVVDGPADLADGRYAVSPNVTCGRCEFCTSGRTNLCRRGGYGIGLGRNGGLAEFVDAPVGNLAPIPDGVDAVTASLTEPIAVHVRGVGLARVSTDSPCSCWARARSGSAPRSPRGTAPRWSRSPPGIHISAPRPKRSASRVVDEAELGAWGKEHRPDIVIESVGGTSDTANDAIRVIRRGGRVVILGSFGTTATTINLQQMMSKEVSLIGSFCYGTRCA